MSKTLFLSPPSFEGYDGGAGARYQTRREVTSYWYPTWLAQPAALVPNSRLLDCPPHGIKKDECLKIAREYDHVIIHTSTPSLRNDCKVAEAIKAQQPDTRLLPLALEVPTDAGSAYVSATFAPGQANGCGATYDAVSYWPQKCEAVAAKQFAGFKRMEQALRKNITVLDGGAATKVFLMPAGSGCVSIKKEVVL